MRKLLPLSLIVGSVALLASAAQALPFAGPAPAIENGVEQARVVCNQWGRCFRTAPRRVIIQPSYDYGDYYDTYNYAPGYSYAPAYGYYGGPSVGFGGPGISFGFGFGGHRHHW